MTGPRVAIVGGGILGAAIAEALTRGGARVSLVDAGAARPQATPGSIAWINASSDWDAAYFELRLRSIALWRDLAAASPDLPVRFRGGLGWEDTPAATEARAKADTDRGYPSRLVDPDEARRLAPGLTPPDGPVVHAAAEGSADPSRIAGAFRAQAAEQGAKILAGEVAAIESAAGRATGLRLADGTRIAADHVVVAAGTATPELLAPLGIVLPMRPSAGVLVRTRPVAPQLEPFLASPGLHGWQLPDGRLIAGESFGGAPDGVDRDAIVSPILARLEERFPEAGPLRADRVTAAVRPIPEDGLPVLGRVPEIAGLAVATTHSGVTLAPAIGAILAAEIAGERPDPMAERYRIDRFSTPIATA